MSADRPESGSAILQSPKADCPAPRFCTGPHVTAVPSGTDNQKRVPWTHNSASETDPHPLHAVYTRASQTPEAADLSRAHATSFDF